MAKRKKKGILRYTEYRNKLNTMDETSAKVLNYYEEMSNNHIQFQYLKDSGKLLETYYVLSYQVAKSKEEKERYFLRIFCGHFNYVKLVAEIVYTMKRVDDMKTLADLIQVAPISLMKSLDNYVVDNEYNARFLAYWEKHLQGLLLRTARHNSIFHLQESFVEYMTEVKNRIEKKEMLYIESVLPEDERDYIDIDDSVGFNENIRDEEEGSGSVLEREGEAIVDYINMIHDFMSGKPISQDIIHILKILYRKRDKIRKAIEIYKESKAKEE